MSGAFPLSPSSLEAFYALTQRLQPSIGTFGGRYFTHGGKSHTLNGLVQTFRRLVVQTSETENFSRFAAPIIQRIRVLDATSKGMLAGKNLLVRICTWVREWFQNLFYDRERPIKEIETLITIKSILEPSVSGASAPFSSPRPSTAPLSDAEIQGRLAKNLGLAMDQQAREFVHGFRLQDLPDDLLAGWSKEPIVLGAQELEGRQAGMAACKGYRPTMEDTDLVTQVEFLVDGQPRVLNLFAVFDGHGGPLASRYIKEKIANALKEMLEKHNPHELTDVGIWQSLKECFVKLDAEYHDGTDGTTATVALILGDDLWVANVGDSRTIISHGGRAVQLSEDAKPNEPRFEQGVEKLGGYVFFGRVMGSLAVARAIGDKDLLGRHGCCVSPKPKITRIKLDDLPPGSHLILACDGLFDVASTHEVVAAVNTMADEGTIPAAMAARLVYSAIFNGSRDNVSVMVVRL